MVRCAVQQHCTGPELNRAARTSIAVPASRRLVTIVERSAFNEGTMARQSAAPDSTMSRRNSALTQYWLACTLAHNVPCGCAPWGCPRVLRRARGKRLRQAFLNVPARLARTGRRLHVRFPAAYAHVEACAAALREVQALRAFGWGRTGSSVYS